MGRVQMGPALVLGAAVLLAGLCASPASARATWPSWPSWSTEPVREDLRISGLRIPQHQDARQWLEAYYTDHIFGFEPSHQPGSESAHEEGGGAASCPATPAPSYWGKRCREAAELGSLAWGAGSPYSSNGSGSGSGGGRRKRNLILVPAGDSWDPAKSRWLESPEIASFDVLPGYYGRNAANFSCPHCLRPVAAQGGKWKIMFEIAQSDFWFEEVVAAGYEYVMLADDDLVIDTCSLNQFFDTMKKFDLLLAQPSICPSTQDTPSASALAWLTQQPEYLMRYTTMVEIMAPTMRMDLFHNVFRHLLNGTHSGWGLDRLLPALLLFPRDKLAVVDSVCMVHPPFCMGGGHFKHLPKDLPPCTRQESTYQAAGVRLLPYQEQNLLLAAFNYTEATTYELGFPYLPENVTGCIPNPAFWPSHVIRPQRPRLLHIGGGAAPLMPPPPPAAGSPAACIKGREWQHSSSSSGSAAAAGVPGLGAMLMVGGLAAAFMLGRLAVAPPSRWASRGLFPRGLPRGGGNLKSGADAL